MTDDLLQQGAEELGVVLTPQMREQFQTYYEFLDEKNRVMNLTAISGWEDTVRLHFLDCIAVAGLLPVSRGKLIDIGSGAGFPGVPLAIVRPELQLTAVDAQKKRTDFLTGLFEKAEISNAVSLHARAEELALDRQYRGHYDIGASRAVAALSLLCELSLPFIRTGGIFVAMKSIECDQEVREARNALRVLGGTLEKQLDYAIPGTEIVHRLLVIRKEKETPAGYPRRFAKIQKNSL